MYHPLLGLCSVIDTELVLNPEEVVTSVVAEANPTYDFFTKQARILDTPPHLVGKREAETTTTPSTSTNSTSGEDDDGRKKGFGFRPREPPRYDAPISAGHSTPLQRLRPDLFKNSINVNIYLPGQFFMTAAGVSVDVGTVEEVYLHQDVTDKVIE